MEAKTLKPLVPVNFTSEDSHFVKRNLSIYLSEIDFLGCALPKSRLTTMPRT